MRGIHQHIEQSKNDRENGCDPGNSMKIAFKISAFFMNIMIKKQAEQKENQGQNIAGLHVGSLHECPGSKEAACQFYYVIFTKQRRNHEYTPVNLFVSGKTFIIVTNFRQIGNACQ